MNTVTTYLSFNGNCRQAMSFYQQCLGSELEISPYPDADGQPSSDPEAKIMHSQLVRAGAPILMASDTPQPESLQQATTSLWPSTAIRWTKPSVCSRRSVEVAR